MKQGKGRRDQETERQMKDAGEKEENERGGRKERDKGKGGMEWKMKGCKKGK